ncbi:MAG: hypothetical protein ABEJ60_07110 [Halodesulfurarchaeum sp.]
MHHRPIATILAVWILIGSVAVGPVAAGTGGDDPGGASVEPLRNGAQIVRTMTLSLTPSVPGSIEARLAFAIPDQVVELKSSIPARATVIEATGFTPDGTGNYTWDGGTPSPSVTVSIAVNRTGASHRSFPGAGGASGLLFADTGDWAVLPVPTAAAWWTDVGADRPGFRSRTVLSGEGVAGRRMAFLGAHTTSTRRIGDQRVRLVVPAAASMAVDPAAVLDSLSAAGTSLPASPVTETVLIAAPTSVDWGPSGLAARTDAWVRADQSLAVPGNVWIHEFVHLRQDFETTAETRWLREAMAEYNAAQLSFARGRIDFETLSTHLNRGTRSRYAETVLSRPGTWAPLANYAKGALVYGTLDYRIRQRTDRRYSARHLFEAMNRHPDAIDHAFLHEHLERIGGTELAAAFHGYVTTASGPPAWPRSAHERAIGTASADVTVSVDGPIRISGPYRTGSVESIPPLVPGERLSIPVTVANAGGKPAQYRIELTADGIVVATATGALDSGESERVELAHTFAETGTVGLTLDSTTWAVEVLEPATPVVSAIHVPEGPVDARDAVEIRVTIDNPRDRPAGGTIPLRIDGQASDPIGIALGPGETVVRPVAVSLGKPGDHAIAIGDRTATIPVAGPSTRRPAAGPTDTATPGFGFGAAVAALLVTGRIAVGRIN